MYRNLKENQSYKKTLCLFGIMFVLFTLGSLYVSDILMTLGSAAFAVFILFDKTSYKWLSLSLFAAVLVGVCFLSLSSSVFVITSFLCALVLAVGYIKGLNKAEISLYLTVLYAFCTACGLYLIGAKEIGSFDVTAVVAYYQQLFDDLVVSVIKQIQSNLEAAVLAGQELTLDIGEYVSMIEETFLSLSKTFLSLLVVIAFLYSGIQIKLFSVFVKRCELTPRPRQEWHFALSNLFAYFYIALAVLSLFVGSMENVMGIALVNLNNIFMFVFAYIGFNYALFFTSRMQNKTLARVVFVILLVTMNVLAIQLLSYIGVFITTSRNRFLKNNPQNPDSKED